MFLSTGGREYSSCSCLSLWEQRMGHVKIQHTWPFFNPMSVVGSTVGAIPMTNYLISNLTKHFKVVVQQYSPILSDIRHGETQLHAGHLVLGATVCPRISCTGPILINWTCTWYSLGVRRLPLQPNCPACSCALLHVKSGRRVHLEDHFNTVFPP